MLRAAGERKCQAHTNTKGIFPGLWARLLQRKWQRVIAHQIVHHRPPEEAKNYTIQEEVLETRTP